MLSEELLSPEAIESIIDALSLELCSALKIIITKAYLDPSICNKNKFEIVANLFAAHVLTPDKFLSPNAQTMSEIAEELSVPLGLLQLKLESAAVFL